MVLHSLKSSQIQAPRTKEITFSISLRHGEKTQPFFVSIHSEGPLSSSGFPLRWSISMPYGLLWTSSSTTRTWSLELVNLSLSFNLCEKLGKKRREKMSLSQATTKWLKGDFAKVSKDVVFFSDALQVMFSPPIFILAEVIFSIYFTAEVIIRYTAYPTTMTLGDQTAEKLNRSWQSENFLDIYSIWEN